MSFISNIIIFFQNCTSQFKVTKHGCDLYNFEIIWYVLSDMFGVSNCSYLYIKLDYVYLKLQVNNNVK